MLNFSIFTKSKIKKIISNIIIFIFCFNFSSIKPNNLSTNHNHISSSKPMQAYLNQADFAMYLSMLILTLNANKEDKSYLDQLKPKNLLKNFAEVYITLFFTSLCHELGHSLISYALDGKSINIHFASPSTNLDQPPLLNLGPLKIHSLNPMQAVSRGGKEFENPILNITHVAAGPIAGIIGYYIIKSIKNFYIKYKNKTENPNLLKAIKSATYEAVVKKSPLDSIALGQLLYLLLPMGNIGDGSKIYKTLGFNPRKVDAVGRIAPYFIFILPAIFAFYQANKSEITYDALMSAINKSSASVT